MTPYAKTLQTVPTTVADVCGGGDRSETRSTDQQTRSINGLKACGLVVMEAQTNT